MTTKIILALAGILLLVAGQSLAWQNGYHEDFSADPGWTTNDPTNFYWDATQGAYYGKQIDCQGQYAYVQVPGYNGGSFQLQFDIQPTVNWAGNINIGLVGPSMTMFPCGGNETSIHFMFAVDDPGSHTMLRTTDDNGYCDVTQGPFPTQGTWYHCLVEYSCATDSINFEVTLKSTGGTVFVGTQVAIGPFKNIDRLAWSGIGDNGYCGDWGAGLVDNVDLFYNYSKCTTSIDATTWGAVKGIFR